MANKVNLDISEKLDITCRQGDTFSLTITLKDSTGADITLLTSNYQFLMQVWEVNRSSVLPVIGSASFGEQVDLKFEPFVTDDNGNVTISATAATMRAVSAKRYVYDLQYILENASGGQTHTTVLRGSFIVNSDVSKSL